MTNLNRYKNFLA